MAMNFWFLIAMYCVYYTSQISYFSLAMSLAMYLFLPLILLWIHGYQISILNNLFVLQISTNMFDNWFVCIVLNDTGCFFILSKEMGIFDSGVSYITIRNKKSMPNLKLKRLLMLFRRLKTLHMR